MAGEDAGIDAGIDYFGTLEVENSSTDLLQELVTFEEELKAEEEEVTRDLNEASVTAVESSIGHLKGIAEELSHWVSRPEVVKKNTMLLLLSVQAAITKNNDFNKIIHALNEIVDQLAMYNASLENQTAKDSSEIVVQEDRMKESIPALKKHLGMWYDADSKDKTIEKIAKRVKVRETDRQILQKGKFADEFIPAIFAEQGKLYKFIQTWNDYDKNSRNLENYKEVDPAEYASKLISIGERRLTVLSTKMITEEITKNFSFTDSDETNDDRIRYVNNTLVAFFKPVSPLTWQKTVDGHYESLKEVKVITQNYLSNLPVPTSTSTPTPTSIS